MLTINLFDIPFLANTVAITVVPPSPVTDILYDESGAAYTSGSYDTFEGYSSGSTPTSLGYGWVGNWTFDVLLARSIMAEDFLEYPVGTNISGSSGGSGWATGWNVIQGT
jgi:hypothetical protein